MKVVRIDGRMAKVFVLKETANRLVYIPVKSLFRVDYERMLKMEEQGGDLLKTMAKTTLDNGRNALVQYDNIIQVLKFTSEDKDTGSRVKRPDEIMTAFDKEAKQKEAQQPQPAVIQEPQQDEPEPEQEVKVRRKPGPRPGSKRTRTTK